MTSNRDLAHSDLVVICGVAQEASEGDGVGDATQVDKEHGGDGLDVEALVEVAGDPGQLALDVQVEATTEAAGREQEHSAPSEEPEALLQCPNTHRPVKASSSPSSCCSGISSSSARPPAPPAVPFIWPSSLRENTDFLHNQNFTSKFWKFRTTRLNVLKP